MKFDAKKKHWTTSILIKKLLTSYIVTLILISSFSLILVANASGNSKDNASDNSNEGDISNAADNSNEGDISNAADNSNEGDISNAGNNSNEGDISNAGNNSNEGDTSNAGNNSNEGDIGNAADKNDSVFWDWLTDIYNDDEIMVIGSDNHSYAPNERIVSIEEIESMTENLLGNLSNKEEKRFTLENSETGIHNIEFIPANDLKNVKVKIIELRNKPDEITEIPNKNIEVHKYLDIKFTANEEYVGEEDIESLKFKFKIEQNWILVNNIDKITIKLMRYHDGEWQNLSTTLDTENETCIYYIAESPGCSTFAVVGSKIDNMSGSHWTGLFNISWTIIIVVITLFILILAVVFFKSRIIFS